MVPVIQLPNLPIHIQIHQKEAQESDCIFSSSATLHPTQCVQEIHE